jgi:hypothetical protein
MPEPTRFRIAPKSEAGFIPQYHYRIHKPLAALPDLHAPEEELSGDSPHQHIAFGLK